MTFDDWWTIYDPDGNLERVDRKHAEHVWLAAADAERERLLAELDVAAAEWQADIDAGSLSGSLLQGMVDGVRIVARRIRGIDNDYAK